MRITTVRTASLRHRIVGLLADLPGTEFPVIEVTGWLEADPGHIGYYLRDSAHRGYLRAQIVGDEAVYSIAPKGVLWLIGRAA